jgi:hypothetical protein
MGPRIRPFLAARGNPDRRLNQSNTNFKLDRPGFIEAAMGVRMLSAVVKEVVSQLRIKQIFFFIRYVNISMFKERILSWHIDMEIAVNVHYSLKA